jgi:hypothetical protein
VLILLSLVGLVFLSVGTFLYTQNPIFWLASGAPIYQYLRVLLSLVLVMQLTTHPPRHLWFRIVSGAIAAAVGIWAVESTYYNNMLSLDTLSLLGASIAIGISAIEHKANILDLVILRQNKKKLIVKIEVS